MSRIVKITTIAHNIHFSDEMFTTRLNLTKLKSYHTLTRPPDELHRWICRSIL